MRKERRGASRPIGGDIAGRSRSLGVARAQRSEAGESERQDTRVARKADKERNREGCNYVTCLL